MKGNIAGLMQQAQKMQQEMQKAQAELAQPGSHRSSQVAEWSAWS